MQSPTLGRSTAHLLWYKSDVRGVYQRLASIRKTLRVAAEPKYAIGDHYERSHRQLHRLVGFAGCPSSLAEDSSNRRNQRANESES